jgi:hypothetical protein
MQDYFMTQHPFNAQERISLRNPLIRIECDLEFVDLEGVICSLGKDRSFVSLVRTGSSSDEEFITIKIGLLCSTLDCDFSLMINNYCRRAVNFLNGRIMLVLGRVFSHNNARSNVGSSRMLEIHIVVKTCLECDNGANTGCSRVAMLVEVEICRTHRCIIVEYKLLIFLRDHLVVLTLCAAAAAAAAALAALAAFAAFAALITFAALTIEKEIVVSKY